VNSAPRCGLVTGERITEIKGKGKGEFPLTIYYFGGDSELEN